MEVNMKVWATNVKKLHEEVIVPFQVVVWHMYGWNGQTVLYGDDRALFIFDPEEKKLHAFFDGTYLCHKIVGINRVPAQGVTLFRIMMADMEEVRQIVTLPAPLKERIHQLIRGCEPAMTWLAAHEPN